MKLTDEDLKFLNFRLTQRISSDLADAINFVSKDAEMDKLLASAESAIEVFEIMDDLHFCLEKERKRRKF
jgi:hypothetical protein